MIGNIDMIQNWVSRKWDIPYEWNSFLNKACLENNIENVKLALCYKVDKNIGLMYACQGGHKDIVLLLIEEGADCWSMGLSGACKGGHKDLVFLMIEKGYSWDYGLDISCRKGYKDLVLLMIKKGANDWNGGLYGACMGGHKDLALLMINKGATDLSWGLYRAYKEGHNDLVLLMAEKGADISNIHQPLSQDDILRLIHIGIKKFGKYEAIEKKWRQWLKVVRTELNTIMIPDLASIVVTY